MKSHHMKADISELMFFLFLITLIIIFIICMFIFIQFIYKQLCFKLKKSRDDFFNLKV